ncbi:hypothetical protein D9757_003818 [Collybiopsis confluens]|uniref:Uncharacterized protein n=1 Tax=Collybiopsis confluens TaxID=2823264 RepID=A0A8H5HVD1_9AGAR|nr:hypothetical protein D9757_003818 [Collybiopsis confluens]
MSLRQLPVKAVIAAMVVTETGIHALDQLPRLRSMMPPCRAGLGARQHHHIDATYNQGFNDFFITRIGTDANARPNYWTLYIDYQFQQRGGCQLIAKPGQRVLWVFGASENTPFLDLHGPTTVRRNQSTTFGVINGRNGEPIEGATVRGQQTTANGQVQLTFDTAGNFSFKATRNGTIRSPALNILVV